MLLNPAHIINAPARYGESSLKISRERGRGKEIFIFAIKWALNNVAHGGMGVTRGRGAAAAQIAVGSKSRTGKCCPQWAGGGSSTWGPRVQVNFGAKRFAVGDSRPNMTLAGAGSGSGLLLCLIVDPFSTGEGGVHSQLGRQGKKINFLHPKRGQQVQYPTHTHTLVSSS